MEKNKNIILVEHQVTEKGELLKDSDMEKSIHVEKSPVVEQARTRPIDSLEPIRKKEKNYGWAFFVASIMVGLGFTATFDIPAFLFGGLALGFLFFVVPIYQKVMEKIKNL